MVQNGSFNSTHKLPHKSFLSSPPSSPHWRSPPSPLTSQSTNRSDVIDVSAKSASRVLSYRKSCPSTKNQRYAPSKVDSTNSLAVKLHHCSSTMRASLAADGLSNLLVVFLPTSRSRFHPTCLESQCSPNFSMIYYVKNFLFCNIFLNACSESHFENHQRYCFWIQ